MLLLLSGPPGATCWIFCPGIQFYLLLSPYLCFIYFLHLDLYVLGDDTLIVRGISCNPNFYVSRPHLNYG